MAYRRRNGMSRSSTFEEDTYHPSEDEERDKERDKDYATSSSLAARAIRANAAAHSDFSAYGYASGGSDSGFTLDSKEGGLKLKIGSNVEENRKLLIKRKGSDSDGPWLPIQPTETQTFTNNQQTQLKASRDVAMATAAKAKLLLRELKTVKADLAFAKQRCAQLEEENKRLREGREKGVNPADDDELIRLQIETLLAEKARLANENSVYARENRFLREIVEYHHLTMQDLIYLDEGSEEDALDREDCYQNPFSMDIKVFSTSPPSPPEIYNTPKIVKDLMNNPSSLSLQSSSSHQSKLGCSNSPDDDRT